MANLHKELIYPGLVIKLHDGRWVCIKHYEEVETALGPVILFQSVDQLGEEDWPLLWPQHVKVRIGDLYNDFIHIGVHRHAAEVIPFIHKVFKGPDRDKIETLPEENETVL